MSSNSVGHTWVQRTAIVSALAAMAVCTAGAQAPSPIPGDPIVTDAGKVSGIILENGIHLRTAFTAISEFRLGLLRLAIYAGVPRLLSSLGQVFITRAS